MKVAFVILLVALTVVLARDPLCPKQNEKDAVLIHPHESDATKFYICASNGTLSEFQCSEGLIFDTELRVTSPVIDMSRNFEGREVGRMAMLKCFKSLAYICLSESSIHGCPLIVRNKLHFLERLFWIVCIVVCIWSTTDICFGQWSRYANSPIVLSLETNYRSWKFPPVGVTICSNFTDRKKARSIVQRNWNISRNDSKFEYYEKFVLTIATTKYHNLEYFKEFINDESLNGIEFLEVAFEMREKIHDLPSPDYNNVITEMGICQSNTKLANIQQPYRRNISNDNLSISEISDEQAYSSVDIMRLAIIPHILDAGNVAIYIHSKQDVISGADTYHKNLIESDDVLLNVIDLHNIVSSDSLRSLSIKQRKCLFLEEPTANYFPIYTTNLCRIQCRIRAALDVCGCIPFFYNFDINETICNSTGLFCLARSNWYDRKCDCYPLCDETVYFEMRSEKIFYTSYSRFMEVTVRFPKSRIIRRIVFSFYELVVSFGGGAAFFLGCSFLSFVEIVFHICEWFGTFRKGSKETKC